MSQLLNVIANNAPVYIIAEISANHNHDINRAKKIIEVAAEVGADAVKLQTYTADTMTLKCSNEFFQIKGTAWEGRNLYELYEEAHTPWEWHAELIDYAKKLGLECFSTPFDATAVDFLEGLDVPCHKVASFELVDIPLLKKIAATQKPVIMSTGMGTLAEIDEAVKTLRQNGCPEIVLLKCTSAYPALPEEANLRTISNLSESFGCVAGLSDHTLGSAVAVAAVALGAKVVEKHFTLSRADGGPDSGFSMEPDEFKQMVSDIRTVEKALGSVCYELTEKQKESTVFRRSLFVVKDVKEGEELSEENVRSIRPGYGMHTRYLSDVIGRKVCKNVCAGTPLQWELMCS